jgi:xylulokinase
VTAGEPLELAAEPLVLAVDLGTGGPKVGLVTVRGQIRWWEHHAVRTLQTADGAATQDAGAWWRVIVRMARRALAETGVDGDAVAAVAVTGQWASTVPVDDGGTPVGDCVMWMDTRGGPHSRRVVGGPLVGYDPRALAAWVRRAGGVPSTAGADPVGHILYLEHERPDIAGAARWYLEPVDYLTMRFTGTATASPMSMTAAWLTDNRDPSPRSYDESLLRRAGLTAAAVKLPPLVPSGSVVGTVQRSAADEIGIPASAVVVTGMPDLHGATIGSGCVLPFESHLSIGTTAWVSCPMPDKKTDVFRQMATVPGLGAGVPAAYLLGNNQESAGRCLEWFRGAVASAWGGTPTYDEITAHAATAPAGANGVLFSPWLTGERSPIDDRDARGGFHNVAITTTSADLARAVLEGVAANARWLLEAAEHVVGRTLDPLRIIGGGAQSDLWCQIVADVCDRTIERVQDPLLCGLRGAGLAAGMATGEVRAEEVRGLVPVDRVFGSREPERSAYAAVAAELPRLYKSQRRMSRRLNR